MIVLDSTLKSLEAVLVANVAASQLVFTAAWADINTASVFSVSALSESDGLTNNVTAVTLVAAPAASTSRQLKYLSIFNADSANAEVIIRINNNGTTRIVVDIGLNPKDTLLYRNEDGFRVVDTNGNLKTTGGSSSAIFAVNANNALFLNGHADTYFTNASNITTGTLDSNRLVLANTTANGIVSNVAQSFGGDKTFAGFINVGTTLQVAGNTSLTANLYVGVANVVIQTTGAITANGAMTINSTMQIAGNTTINGSRLFANGQLRCDTTNGRMVLPVGANLWAT